MNQLPFEFQRIDVADIAADIGDDDADLPPFRFSRGDLTWLKKSIEKVGLLVPPVVWRLDDSGRNRWLVVDGSRRVAALKALKVDRERKQLAFPLDVITVAVFRGNLAEARRLSAVMHLGTAENNRGDEAVASRWLEEHDWKQADIAKLAGRNQTWVSHSKTFKERLAPAVLQRFRKDERISAKLAHELVKLETSDDEPDEAAQLACLERVLGAVKKPNKPRGRPPGKNRAETDGNGSGGPIR